MVPSPAALRVIGLDPALLSDPQVPGHYEAASQIRERIEAWSPAIFLGWNSLQFDEAILRQALFQTLHPPYLTTSLGNARGDVMRIAQAAHTFAAGALVIPGDGRGHPIFRLDHVAPANDCGPGNIHDAVADAEATLGIARLLKARAPGVWDEMIRWTDRRRVAEFVTTADAFTLTEYVYRREVSRLVAWSGRNPDYEAEMAAFDLAFRPEDYLELTIDDLVQAMSRTPRAIVSLRTTRQPILGPAERAPEGAVGGRLPFEERRRRARLIREDPAFRERVGSALARRRAAWPAGTTLEERLYERRIEAHDEELMRAFHRQDWEDRPRVVSVFADGRLAEAARRLIYVERPDLLSTGERAEMRRWIEARLLSEDPDAGWRTIPAAMRELETLIVDASGPNLAFLSAMQWFLEALMDTARGD